MSGEPRTISPDRPGAWDRRDRAALAAIVAISAGLCLYRLEARSFWFDEVASIEFARSMRFSHLFPRDRNMVAYFLFLKAWLELGDGEWIVRLPSVVFAAGGAALLYLFARRFFDRELALIAAILLVTNASFIRYGQEARGYALELLMVTAAWLVLAVALERRASRWLVLYGLLAGGAVAVHMFAVFFLVPQVISLFFLERGQVPWRKLLMGLGLAAMAALPLFVVAARTGPSQISWILPFSTRTIGHIFSFLTGMFLPFRHDRLKEALSFVLLVFCAAGWAGGLVLTVQMLVKRRRGWEAWAHVAPVLWLAVPLGLAFTVSATVQSLMVPRYFIALLPPSALLLGLAISRIREKVTKYTALGLLVTLNLVGLVWTYESGDTGWRDAVVYVMNKTQPGDSVAFVPNYQRTPFSYYALRMEHVQQPATLSLGTASTVARSGGAISKRVWLMSTHRVEVDDNRQIRSSPEVGTLLRELVPYRVVASKGFGEVGVYLIESRGSTS